MAEDYSRQLARVAAAQIAEAAGYDAVQESAVEILSQLLIRYVSEVSASSHSYAQLSGRTDLNVLDLSLALEDVGTTFSDLGQYLKSKGHEEDGQKQRQELERVQRDSEESVMRLHARIAGAEAGPQDAEDIHAPSTQLPPAPDQQATAGEAAAAGPSDIVPDENLSGPPSTSDAASRVFQAVLPQATVGDREGAALGRRGSSSWLGWKSSEETQEEPAGAEAAALLQPPRALEGSSLDWPTATRRAALRFSFHSLPDAYQEATDDKGATQKTISGRKRKPRGDTGSDPNKERAKELLLQGSRAMDMFDGGDGE